MNKDIEKLFAQIKEIDELKANSMMNVENNLNKIEDTKKVEVLAAQAVNHDAMDNIGPAVFDQEKDELELVFDSDIKTGLNLLAAGYTPDETFFDLERINDGWRIAGGENLPNAIDSVLTDPLTLTAAQHGATYEGEWDDETGKPKFVYRNERI